jgi:membrane complex biogenesis BtpA family protein
LIVNVIQELFGKPRAVIAMAHFPPLPGQPLYDSSGGVAAIERAVRQDVEALADSPVDGVIFCNEGDRPYRTVAGPETVAVMASVIGRLAPALGRPFGVDVLWDPMAAIAIAGATGASFVREVFTGAYAGDFGVWNTDPARTLRYRREIGADRVKLFYNVTAEFAAPLAPRDVELTARSAIFSSLADAVCISGSLTGTAADPDLIRRAKLAVGDAAVIANTGVRRETVADVLEIADAVIVGTALKQEGITWNPIDPDRVEQFCAAAQSGGRWSPSRTPVGVR